MIRRCTNKNIADKILPGGSVITGTYGFNEPFTPGRGFRLKYHVRQSTISMSTLIASWQIRGDGFRYFKRHERPVNLFSR